MRDSHSSEEQLFIKTAEVLSPLLDTTLAVCKYHPDLPAWSTCVVCGAGLCDACSKAVLPRFICPSCQAASTRRKLLLIRFKPWRWPLLWTLLCVSVAGIAYRMGVGNPTVEALSLRDKKVVWFHQDLGTLYLAKASRENQRAAALRLLRQPAKAAEWSARAALTFALTANCWKNTPVYNDLKIGEAVSLAYAGEVTLCLKILRSLNVASGNPVYPSYLYYLGRALEQSGDQVGAIDCYKKALTAAEAMAEADRGFDKLITMLSGGKQEGNVIASVQQICGVNLKYSDLTEKLAAYHLVPERRTESIWQPKSRPVPEPEKKNKDDDFTVEVIGQGKR